MDFVGTFWALVPPLIAIVLAIVTKETYCSLFLGIVTAALLLSGFSPIHALDSIIVTGVTPAVSENAGIFIFLVELGIIVALIGSTGAANAFGNWALKHVKSRTGALLVTLFLGVLIFIDDYFTCLTVGTVMRPVTDKHRISRAKLSYIVDATAAPVCMIAPISSWAAAVAGLVPEGINGIMLFIQAIPFNFYSLLTLVFLAGLILMAFDYGPMAKAELEVARTGLIDSLGDDEVVESSRAHAIDMILPVVVLIVSMVAGMLYTGGYFRQDFSGSIIDAFANAGVSVALPWGGLITMVFTYTYILLRRTIDFRSAMECCTKGFSTMAPALLILIFACSLKNLTIKLGAATYVAELMKGVAGGLHGMLPAVIFLVAVFLAFSTGTSWGTFGILIPIVLPIFAHDFSLLTISISACLAGAVCGDHCSLISDTTIMASAGANVNHVRHVTTQLPYAVPVAVISFLCFILAGFVRNFLICLAVGMVLTIGMLVVMRFTVQRKDKVTASNFAQKFDSAATK